MVNKMEKSRQPSTMVRELPGGDCLLNVTLPGKFAGRIEEMAVSRGTTVDAVVQDVVQGFLGARSRPAR
ncbi:MAG TPA: hypothetical protein VM658_07030 [bacterium]|nr:hypothetical protein [bacterium]